MSGLSSPLPQPPAESSSAHGKGGEDGMGPLESHGKPWKAIESHDLRGFFRKHPAIPTAFRRQI